MANDVAKRAYLPRASDNDKNVNDDSSLGGYEDRFNIQHAGSRTNKEDEVFSREAVRQMVAVEDDDSMHEENSSPFENRHENGHFSNEDIINTDDDAGLDFNENDDSSVEGYRTPFQNHQQAHANTDDDIKMGLVLANQNEDTVTSEEHEDLANQDRTDHSHPFDFRENDDSSIEGYKTPFKDHQETHANADDDETNGLAFANENDDTVVSEEHEFLENQHGKDRSRYPAEFLSKRARLQVTCSYCCKFVG